MRMLDDKRLYTDIDYCLEHWRRIYAGQGLKPKSQDTKQVICHAYWYGMIGPKQILSIKSLLATQDSSCEIWLWLDAENGFRENIENPLLKPFRDHVRVLPYRESLEVQHTVFQISKNPIAWMSPSEWKKWILIRNRKNNLSYRADLFRMVILSRYGGLYFDLDVLFLNAVSRLVDLCLAGDICYQWSNQRYANQAILSMRPNSPNGLWLLDRAVSCGSCQPWKIMRSDVDADAVDFRVLPCAYFDPLWLHHDKINRSQFAPFDDFDGFFLERSEMSDEDFQAKSQPFFGSCFAYHWHNRWKAPEVRRSYAGYFNACYDRVIQERFGVVSKPIFQA